ncbi:hypothetical protein KLP40_03860 [Hymenobacter sp. NST-14]|uniref:thermonuclease family protein n=1 Tax=Hymenobacter piscis TaxID=2839984 RepID=UPI001C027036|nr:hypothetical protein [Hymenobacter piscis]MBT9392289.1 hypothetical protein [Hymenobacter piscis]
MLLTSNWSAQAQVRASRLARLLLPAPAAVTLPTSPVWQLLRVERVVDADTYEVAAGGGRVRVHLLGDDAPEADQPFGPEPVTGGAPPVARPGQRNESAQPGRLPPAAARPLKQPFFSPLFHFSDGTYSEPARRH